MFVVVESHGGVPTRLTLRPPAEVSVLRGQPLDITCAGQGSPAPAISWRRGTGPERAGARLAARQAGPEHAGRWVCRLASPLGDLEAHTTVMLLEPLKVTLTPRAQVTLTTNTTAAVSLLSNTVRPPNAVNYPSNVLTTAHQITSMRCFALCFIHFISPLTEYMFFLY